MRLTTTSALVALLAIAAIVPATCAVDASPVSASCWTPVGDSTAASRRCGGGSGVRGHRIGVGSMTTARATRRNGRYGPRYRPPAVGKTPPAATTSFAAGSVSPGFVRFCPKAKAPRTSCTSRAWTTTRTVYLNGRQLAAHEGWNDPFDVNLDAGLEGGRAERAGRAGREYGRWRRHYWRRCCWNTEPAQSGRPGGPRTSTTSDWRTVHLPHDFVVEGTFSQQADRQPRLLADDKCLVSAGRSICRPRTRAKALDRFRR